MPDNARVTIADAVPTVPVIARRPRRRDAAHRSWRGYALATAIVAVCTGVSAPLHEPTDLGNVVAVYLLGVVLAAASLGRGPAVLAAVLGAFAVDFLILPPVFGLLPDHAPHLLTLALMLIVAASVGTLAARLREQLEQARERERNTATLHGLARDLARAADAAAVATAVDHHACERFGWRGVLLATDASGEPRRVGGDAGSLDRIDASAVRDAIGPRPRTAADPTTIGAYLPLTTSKGTFGVLALLPVHGDADAEVPQRHHLEAFANLTATALERTLLADTARDAAVAVEQERMRNTLLSSVSHDLRTPVAAIIGASSALLLETSLDTETRTGLLESIHQEGGRLERQIRNLLDLTRLEAGAVQVHPEWTPVEDVVGAALTRLEDALRGREVVTRIAPDLSPVPMDGMLVEQALLNLIENALRHTPTGTPIEISVRATTEVVCIEVADRGPGIAADALERVFDKFHGRSRAGGFGLGLSICRAIASLHGGSATADNRAGGGAVFTLALPLVSPPSLPPLSRNGATS